MPSPSSPLSLYFSLSFFLFLHPLLEVMTSFDIHIFRWKRQKYVKNDDFIGLKRYSEEGNLQTQIRIHLHTLVYIHTHTHAHTYTRSHIHMLTHKHVLTHTHTYTHIHTHTQVPNTYTHIYTHIHTFTHMHTHTQVQNTYTHICTHTTSSTKRTHTHTLLFFSQTHRCAHWEGRGDGVRLRIHDKAAVATGVCVCVCVCVCVGWMWFFSCVLSVFALWLCLRVMCERLYVNWREIPQWRWDLLQICSLCLFTSLSLSLSLPLSSLPLSLSLSPSLPLSLSLLPPISEPRNQRDGCGALRAQHDRTTLTWPLSPCPLLSSLSLHLSKRH